MNQILNQRQCLQFNKNISEPKYIPLMLQMIEKLHDKFLEKFQDLQKKVNQVSNKVESILKDSINYSLKEKVVKQQCKEIKIIPQLNLIKQEDFQNIQDSVKISFLQEYREMKEREAIESQLIQRNISCKYSKLLYHSSQTQINFHERIDNINNILLVVTLKNKKIIGGFTQIAFKKRVIPQDNPKSFIINATDNQVFQPKNSYKTIIYDPRYIIFGNSQLRIKTGQMFLYSNLGIIRSFFEANERSIFNLLGQSNREVPIEKYEIYQIY